MLVLIVIGNISVFIEDFTGILFLQMVVCQKIIFVKDVTKKFSIFYILNKADCEMSGLQNTFLYPQGKILLLSDL